MTTLKHIQRAKLKPRKIPKIQIELDDGRIIALAKYTHHHQNKWEKEHPDK